MKGLYFNYDVGFVKLNFNEIMIYSMDWGISIWVMVLCYGLVKWVFKFFRGLVLG